MFFRSTFFVDSNSMIVPLSLESILKLFMDGHLIVKNKLAKKLPGIDKYRYYRCYDIIGSVPPICLS